jgi:hypothetical protein
VLFTIADRLVDTVMKKKSMAYCVMGNLVVKRIDLAADAAA